MNGGRMRRVELPQPAREHMVTLEVPESLALQLRPELAEIDPEARTNYQGPPFSGEEREEKFGDSAKRGFNPATSGPLTLCTLQRPWPLVGFCISPGNLTPGGGVNQIVAALFAIVKGNRALLASFAIVGGGPPVAMSVIAGAQCELVIIPNTAATPNPITGVTGTLWGSYNR